MSCVLRKDLEAVWHSFNLTDPLGTIANTPSGNKYRIYLTMRTPLIQSQSIFSHFKTPRLQLFRAMGFRG